ncbi:hypothetical protein M0R04_16565 [Candidatus Dojkabacteria bacterium]|jgi:hypothetical protein|nr:hypothetical protein [Candidatus Dojkabacteria bacterium]
MEYTKVSNNELKVTKTVEEVINIDSLVAEQTELSLKIASLQSDINRYTNTLQAQIDALQERENYIDAIMVEALNVGVEASPAEIEPVEEPIEN